MYFTSYVRLSSQFDRRLIRLISFRSFLLLHEEKFNQFIGLTQILKNYFKSTKGRMYKGSEFSDKEYNFYNEREWRYVPFRELERLASVEKNVRTFLSKDEFNNLPMRETHNTNLSKYCSLPFKPSDINYLFVENRQDLKVLITFIEDEYLVNQPKLEIQTLISKIAVLEQILADI